MSRPFLSVIVPAHQAMHQLEECLPALRASDIPPESWELIVVDDASTDDTELVAAAYADTVIRLAGNPHGPAYARNRAAEASRGDVLVFVDADVLVHRDALRRFAVLFAEEPEIAAAFGSYDAAPRYPGLVSQYRNLLHHYVHTGAAGPAETFWAGLGAVRRDVFLGMGMFDEWHYARPQIEDIELGRRLRRAGYGIRLDPAIQGKHLKRWTLRNMLSTDFRSRGVPWMWLILKEGPSSGSGALNLRLREKVCTGLVGLAVLATVAAPILASGWLLALAATSLAIVAFLNLRLYLFMFRRGSWRLALVTLPLHMAYYIINVLAVFSGWLAHTLFGEPSPPAERQALAQLGVDTWPPSPKRRPDSIWSAQPPDAGSGGAA